ncbi:protein ECT2 isoform X6 [Amyelois transitella]|uniref:protein ECT2 isoform X6 n=1 Tax=Amyelois transitella TaxID=680683 RepID=UPI00298FCAF0|nr:protein ECT2 isoform X6 [Amyelois transitella]
MDELSKGMTQTGSTAATDKIQENDGSSTPIIYLNESCMECERVRAACERLGSLAPAPSSDMLPMQQPPPQPPCYLITAPFDGELFDAAHRAKYRVLGPTAVLQLAERDEPPPANARPLYTLSMRGAVICFSGFRKKDELTNLITLIHYMGGSIRKDMSSKVTHLIAAAATGDKYRYASGFGLPVLARSWVDACWERRDDPACLATDEAVIKEHKLKVFAGARVCFMGFPEDETQHMAEVLASNGGATCAIDDPDCTHVVVDEHNTAVAPECSVRVHVVKAEWFWASVQNEEAQDERDYLFKDYLDEVSRRSSVGGAGVAGAAGAACEEEAAGSGAGAAGSTPAQLQRLRKRKLRGGDAALHKRRSSVSDAVLLSLSGNLLDCTPSPDGKQRLEESEVPDNVVRKLMSPRQQVFMELLQTESNYVGILHTIDTLFKQPLEEMTEEDTSNGKNQPLLNNTELRNIFGNLPPIYELHQRMLEDLRHTQSHWSEEASIGRIVLKYTPDMLKAYPPFINFFENTKDMLQQCDRENPRFHAFLKICQTRPECGRQSLQELLIRPVQRLPSISLLLDDILKHTHKNNPDHSALVSALAGLREVMSHINEDKRKTEGQLQMFDIYHDIEHCPADLVSSHRSFVARCEVVELSKELSGRGDHLVFFLFTDTMEVCKKRSKAFNSKSPTNGTSTMRSSKPYRHIQLMPLSTVKRVVDIREAEDCHNVFALMCRNNQELKEQLYSFMITDDAVDKQTFLRQLCRQMANTVCKADADKFLTSLDSHQLDIDTSDLALSTLSKVSKFAARTRIKLEALAGLGGWLRAEPAAGLLDTWVLRAHLLTLAQVGRALSFNKTPSKLKRAMSSMISPFGSNSNLNTPASQLAQMRLASCNNINEMGAHGGGGAAGGVLVAPLSVQPTRKAGAAAALRRF